MCVRERDRERKRKGGSAGNRRRDSVVRGHESLAEGTKGSTEGQFGRLKVGLRASRMKSKSHGCRSSLLPGPGCLVEMEMTPGGGDMDVMVPSRPIRPVQKLSSPQAGSFPPPACRDITGVTALPGNLPASSSLCAQGIPGWE